MSTIRLVLLFVVLIFTLPEALWGRTLYVENYSYHKSWMKLGDNDEVRVNKLVQILSQSPTGKRIVAKAAAKARADGKTVTDIILPGHGSVTDTTLIRRFSAESPEHVSYESKSVVYIDRNHILRDALLDLAHELTHFTYRTPFNPYVKNFTLKQFVASTVEGRGGEVDAYLVECQVHKELFPRSIFEQSNCSKVVDPNTGKISRVHGIRQFYKVGRDHSTFQKLLRKWNEKKNRAMPQVTSDEATFISSAYGLPYPVAAAQEWVGIMQKACENDRRRISYLKERLGRHPASSETPLNNPDLQIYRQMSSSYEERCAAF